MSLADATAIVLAAGHGTRMKSALPKVLHPLLGRPIVSHVVAAALRAGVGDVVVVIGHGGEAVTAALRAEFGDAVRTAVQPSQRGTGDAAACGLREIDLSVTRVLVLAGDAPLVRPEDLGAVLSMLDEGNAALAMLTMRPRDPQGYGRVVRSNGRVACVREERDCDEAERAIGEVNAGVFAFGARFLRESLPALRPNNTQGELYLTDLVAAAAAAGGAVARETDAASMAGINDRAQLARVERVLRRRVLDRWRREGVTIGGGVSVDVTVELARDVVLGTGAVLRGTTRVAEGARVDVGCVITDTEIGPGAVLKPYSVATNARVGAGAQVGPFAHLRPGSDLHQDAHIGNFVETKNTVVRAGAKANHLAYLGDGDVGEGANVGAGVIFCNYDGFRKHRTIIGARAFIGSDCQLVAPVSVGEGAYVATGTTVTSNVPADALAVGRVRQEVKPGYAARLRERLRPKKQTD